MRMFDTHSHYTDESFDADRHEVLSQVHDSGVELVLNAASDGESSLQAVALAEKYPFVYAAVGWHPHEANSFKEGSEEQLRQWSQNPKVRAIGEIGLDYYYDLSDRETQKKVFARQLELVECSQNLCLHFHLGLK